MSATGHHQVADDDATAAPLQLGELVAIDGIGKATVERLHQRNWSRVATARCGDREYFLKQFIDRVGRPHHRGYDGDNKTLATLGSEIAGVSIVPQVDRVPERLLTVSPHIEMTTIDSISRRDRQRHEIPDQVGDALARILASRTRPENPDRVAVWKGLDPKNIGWSADGRLWIFDFGPPVDSTLSDAAALVVAAGLLSRWVARPGLHLVAPEKDILRGVVRPVAPMTTLPQVQEALRRHQDLRRREPQRTGLSATATRFGLQTVGRVHWRAVNREAQRLFR